MGRAGKQIDTADELRVDLSHVRMMARDFGGLSLGRETNCPQENPGRRFDLGPEIPRFSPPRRRAGTSGTNHDPRHFGLIVFDSIPFRDNRHTTRQEEGRENDE